MDIQAEKLQLIEQVLKLQNTDMINQVKELLEEFSERELLEKSIDRGVEQSRNGEVRPHNEVMAEMRSKYSA